MMVRQIMKKRKFLIFVAFAVCGLVFTGCSINKMAMNAVANALSGEGSSDAFTGDSDPQLVGDAIPFAIKMYEVLLSSNPNHVGLLNTTGSIFVMYANAFVQGPAEMLPSEEWQQREEGMARAKRLYLRGHEYLYRALDIKYPGFRQANLGDGSLQAILQKCKKEDVGTLYWAVAGGLAAYSIDILDFELSSHIPEWSAMIQRAYELDPDYNGSALEEFLIIYYGSLPPLLGGDKDQAKVHFERALEKSNGKSASAYVAYVQSICISAQDYDTFKDYLEKALAINPDADTSTRLVTIITQRKARWMLANAYTYFSFLPYPDDY
jgi:predicted anti-sigma-YlaC factor YlaD